MAAIKLIKREDAFLDFLLDPRLFGERVPGPSRIDRQRLSRAIALLRKLPQIGAVAQATQILVEEQTWWQEEARSKRARYVSPIQSRTGDGPENVELTERLFVATLIARKRGPKPYEFVHSRIKTAWFTPKAIEMRVRRFERHLAPQGPRSCRHIALMKYHQFLSIQRNGQVLTTLGLYLRKKISFESYSEALTRLTIPSRREAVWLDSLCRRASPNAKVAWT